MGGGVVMGAGVAPGGRGGGGALTGAGGGGLLTAAMVGVWVTMGATVNVAATGNPGTT